MVPAQPQLSTVVCAGRDTNRHSALERRHNRFGPQHSFPGRYVEVVIQIGATYLKIRMSRQAYTQIKVSGCALTNPLFTHTGNPYGLAFAHPRWDADLQSLGRRLATSRVGPLQGDSALRALQHLFKRNQNIAFDIPAAASKRGSPGRLGSRAAEVSKTAKASAATEKWFKKIPEAGAVEPELEWLLAPRTTSSLTVPPR